MDRRRNRLALSAAFLVASLGAAATDAQASKEVLKAKGVAVTGPNDRCGQSVFSIPGLIDGPATHGTSVGRFDDGVSATTATPLAPGDCDEPDPDARLATFVDDAHFAAEGWPEPDERLENVRLRAAPVAVGNGVWAQVPLAGSLPPNPLPPFQTEPSTPITLESWLEATGRLKIVCEDAGTAELTINAKKLVPHGLYSAWGVWRDFAATGLLTAPLGGMPNLVVADHRGRAKLQRVGLFCPLELTSDGSSLIYVRLIWHADGGGSGSTPADFDEVQVFVGFGGGLPFQSTLPLGIHRFDHLAFPVGAG